MSRSGIEPTGAGRFDALTEEALRERPAASSGPATGRRSVPSSPRWTSAPPRRSPARLHEAVDAGRLGYLTPEAAADMARACAGWHARRYGWEVPAGLGSRPLADVVAGLQAAIERFTPAGTPVVLPTPAYMPFLTVPGRWAAS